MPLYPTFVVIGAMRSGTTSLHAALRHHPNVFMSPVKGPALFVDVDEPIRYPSKYANFAQKRGDQSDDELIGKLVSGYAGEAHFGEATDLYTRFPAIRADVAGTMLRCNPNMRLVYLLRHPVARLLSQFRFEQTKPWNTPPNRLREYLRASPDAIDTSRYWQQLARFLDAGFQEDRVCVIVLEELLQDQREAWARLCRFLDIPFVAPPVFANLNAAPASARRSASCDGVQPEELADLLRPDVASLERFVGRRIDVWDLS